MILCLSPRHSAFLTLHKPKLAQSSVKRRFSQTATLHGFREFDLPALPCADDPLEVVRGRYRGPAKVDASRAGSGDALCLSTADALALVLGHEAQYLQHEVGDERAHQVLAVAGVQKRHVDHADIHPDLLRQHPPLAQYLLVIASQPVDAEDVQQVAGLQAPDELSILRPVEVLAGLLVDVDVPGRDQLFPQRDQLPLLVLVLAGNTRIAVCRHRMIPPDI